MYAKTLRREEVGDWNYGDSLLNAPKHF